MTETTAAHDTNPGTTDLLGAGLALNAGFSTFMGLLLAAIPATIGDWLDVSVDGWLRLLGIGLLLHAVALVTVLVRGDRSFWGWRNFAMIAPYPLLMILAAVFGGLSGTGIALVLLDGLVIAMIAALHWAGLHP